MLKIKKAAYTLALINNVFANRDEPVSEAITLIQGIVMEEYGRHMKTDKTPHREGENKEELFAGESYEDDLMRVEK